MKRKKLPIGISTFRTMIEENYLYIDKTKIALNLINGDGAYYFLSRPRRFGKSLFLDTLRTIFDGERELFKGLFIYDKYEFERYPVLRISFNSGDFSSKEAFHKRVNAILDDNQLDLDIECPKEYDSSDCFARIIKEAYLKYNKKVVILVDEYDKPILDNIENQEVATIIRDELKNFYSVIKGADEYLKFVFITGVSKFAKVSLFSGLNNINDITLDKNYSTICGYTQGDVEISFKNYLVGVDMQKLKRWYNGYKFLGDGVYNPFDILLFIDKDFSYRNYWFSTGTPTFLMKVLERNNYYLPNLENVVKNEKLLNSFDVDNIELETLMWQTGYLTISSTKDTPRGVLYSLDIPNVEVQISLMEHIADYITKINNSALFENAIYEALVESDFTKLELNIKTLFSSIPYNLFTKNRMYEQEGYYVSVFYSYLKALGLELIGEDCTNKGRIDLTIKTPNSIVIIEFKVDATTALEQIKEKKYHEKYMSENLPLFIVGIEFNKEDRNISKLEWEKI